MLSFKPEIAELLNLVEQKYSKSLNTSTDFDEFSYHIKSRLKENISASTLKRLWGYVNDAHAPRVHTLDILSVYIGYKNFKAFCDWLKSSDTYNSSFFSAVHVDSRDLEEASLLEIGWSPNRYVKIRSNSRNLYEVLEARETKLQVGDIFEVSGFFLHQPLYLPYILRGGEKLGPFIAGRNGGLTILNRL